MQDFFKALRDYWVIIVFVGSLAVTWVQFDGRITNLEVRVNHIDTQLDTLQLSLNAMQNSMAEIKTSIDFIKNYLINK